MAETCFIPPKVYSSTSKYEPGNTSQYVPMVVVFNVAIVQKESKRQLSCVGQVASLGCNEHDFS